jgi:DNA polymerase III alpha subunit
MKRPRPSAITAMPLMPMIACGITGVCMKSRQGKTETYSVEADNAELRHYLARLARRSRCFSRCPEALKAALKLFMYCFNQRQLHKQRFPNYPAHVYQFI